MAETKEPTPVKPPETKLDKQKCLEHLNKVVEFQNKFVGKPNHNPFLWLSNHKVQELHTELTKGTLTKELQDSILAIPLTEDPIINKNLGNQSPEPEKPKVTLSPSGGIVVQPPPTK